MRMIVALGFLSSVLTAILSIIATVVLTIAWLAPSALSQSVLSPISLVSTFLLIPAFTITVGCIHARSIAEQKALTTLGFGFALIATTLVGSDCYGQLVAGSVDPNTVKGTVEIMGTTHSGTAALLGFGFLGVACLLLAPVLRGGGVEEFTRWSLLVAGLAGFAVAIALPTGVFIALLAAMLVVGIALTLSAIGTAILFSDLGIPVLRSIHLLSRV